MGENLSKLLPSAFIGAVLAIYVNPQNEPFFCGWLLFTAAVWWLSWTANPRARDGE